MGHHHHIPKETSSPFLWTIALVVFIVLVAAWFRYQYGQGVHHGQNHPKEIKAAVQTEEIPDHAAIIEGFDKDLFKKGKKVYESICATCHGVDGNLGANNARKYSSDEFIFGQDPYSLWLTIVNGNGSMAGQTKDPIEAYAAVHYIREQFLKPAGKNYFEITDDYIAKGSWPAPGMVVAEGEGPTGSELKLMPVEVPVQGVMSEMADAHKPSTARMTLLKAAGNLSGSAQHTVLHIARHDNNDAFVTQLASALQKKDQSAFVSLATSPGLDKNGQGLALLSASEFETLSAAFAGAPAE